MLKKIAWLVAFISIASFSEGYFIWFDMPVHFFWTTVALTIVFAFMVAKFGWFRLDDRDLFSQPLFLISILLPVYYFLMMGAWAWKGCSLDLSAGGFQTFLEVSKLPLLFLASSIPLAAIVNNVHRTIQTEKQIREAERKNLFDTYYGHLKFMVEQFEGVEGKELEYVFEFESNGPEEKEVKSQIKVHFPLELYRRIFVLSSPDRGLNAEVSERFLKGLHQEWELINDSAKKVYGRDFPYKSPQQFKAKTVELYAQIDCAYERVCKLLCLGGYHSEYSFLLSDKYEYFNYTSTFFNVTHMYDSLRSLGHVTSLLLEKIHGEEVAKYFSLDVPVFKMGPGFRSDWYGHLTFGAISDYQEPQLHRNQQRTAFSEVVTEHDSPNY